MMPPSMADKQRRFAQYQRQARANPTPAESLVKDALEKLGVKFYFQKGFLRDDTIRLVDFYITRPDRICLEVDGKYHEKQREYDRYRETRIARQRKKPVRFVRVTNEWVFDQSDLAASLKQKLLD